jgi:ActR/RegA family two-component response regulator
MLTGVNVLIVEDGGLIGHDLAMAVEDLLGFPVIVSTVSEGLRNVSAGSVSAAILDAQLSDGEVSPLAQALIESGIPFVIYTGGTSSFRFESLLARHAVVLKPAPSSDVMAALEREVLSAGCRPVSFSPGGTADAELS